MVGFFFLTSYVIQPCSFQLIPQNIYFLSTSTLGLSGSFHRVQVCNRMDQWVLLRINATISIIVSGSQELYHGPNKFITKAQILLVRHFLRNLLESCDKYPHTFVTVSELIFWGQELHSPSTPPHLASLSNLHDQQKIDSFLIFIFKHRRLYFFLLS